MKFLSGSSSGKSLGTIVRPITKHSTIIFIMVALLVAMFCVITVQQLLSVATDSNYETKAAGEAIKTKFDQKTIEKVKNLRARQETAAEALPSGRINPFTTN